MKSVSHTYEFHSKRVQNSCEFSMPRNNTKLEFRHSYLLFSLAFLLIVFAETFSYSAVGIVYSYFQAFLVVLALLRGKLFRAILLHLVFVLTSLEWPADLALRPQIYTYRTVSIFGVSISTIVLSFLFLEVAFKRGIHFRLTRGQMWFLTLIFSAILTGFFGLVFSDYRLPYFIADLQYWTVLIMSAGLGFAFFSANESGVSTFENVLLFVLCSRSLVSFFGSLLGFQKGMYGGIATFTYDAIDLLITFIILTVLEETRGKASKFFISLCWFLGLAKTLLFGGSGKGILLLAFVLVVLFTSMVSRKSSLLARSSAVILIIIAIIFFFLVMPTLLERNLLLSIKYNQALSILSPSWITDPYVLAASPRDRVLEFYNTAAYYSQHPLFIIAGRGFGGYFEDDAFYNYTASDAGGYSTFEVKTRKFANPHESLNVIFLKFGITGILVWLSFLRKFIGFKKYQSRTSLFLRISGFILVFLLIGFSLKIAFLIGFYIASIKVGDEVSNVQDALC